MPKIECPKCGYHALAWDPDLECWVCYDCGWTERRVRQEDDDA